MFALIVKTAKTPGFVAEKSQTNSEEKYSLELADKEENCYIINKYIHNCSRYEY